MTSKTDLVILSDWDLSVQQFHGGQDWKDLKNFVEDFSVTTNGLGIPNEAKRIAEEAISTCDHYPPANQEPAKSALASFLWADKAGHYADRLLLGNGASELIDLVVRSAPQGNWKPGPWDTQYKEYERSATTHGRTLLPSVSNEPAAITCIVNPCNPTGDYMPLEEMKAWVEANVQNGSAVVIDESMQPWHSPLFRQDSITSQHEWVSLSYSTRAVSVYVIHSWTKLWSCTGLRLGSVVCPTTAHCSKLRKLQVPWSVNTPALAFLHAVVHDGAYLSQTWTLTPQWRSETIEEIKRDVPAAKNWKFQGMAFLSWIWIQAESEKQADRAVEIARKHGVPVRSGRPGYERPNYVRIAVREPVSRRVLIDVWRESL